MPDFVFNEPNKSLAGFGYQDPAYDPYDGMSKPGTYTNYGSSLGNVSASDPLEAIMSAAEKIMLGLLNRQRNRISFK